MAPLDADSISSATATAQVLTPSDEQAQALARDDKDQKSGTAATSINKSIFHDSPNPSAPWVQQINWLNVTLIVLIPLYGCVQAYWVPLQTKTAVWAVVYYFMTGLGITAGE